MRSKKYWLLIFALVSGSLLGADQKYVSFKNAEPSALSRGKTGEAVLEIEIGKEFHIQANPASTPQLIPTTLELSKEPGLTVQKVIYPSGKPYRLQSSPEEISVYSGTLRILIPIAVDKKAKAGLRRVKAKLRFQACNDTICFFPLTIPMDIPLRIQDK